MTDKQHKKLIARYVECGNYSQVAREFHVSVPTVKKHVLGDSEALKRFQRKKEQNTLSMLAFMESQTGSLQELCLILIEAMKDPARMREASLREVATAFGIIVDKIMQCAPKDNDEMLQKARDILGDINGVIR